MRLDKFLANYTDLTRRTVQYAIRDNRVQVNGSTQVKANQKVAPDAAILLDGQLITTPEPVYLMVNKPLDVVCTHDDATHSTIFDILPTFNAEDLQVAGRLDVDTTGLVLITDDGQWNHKVTSPNKSTGKRYRITTETPIETSSIKIFSEGIMLRNETRATKPALLEIIASNQALLTISEGKYHQVKRMFASVGNNVVALHREAVGNIELDNALLPGQYRPLTALEIASI